MTAGLARMGGFRGAAGVASGLAWLVAAPASSSVKLAVLRCALMASELVAGAMSIVPTIAVGPPG